MAEIVTLPSGNPEDVLTVNLDAITYVREGRDGTRVHFVGGDNLWVTGEQETRLVELLRQHR
jgi:hypothetical protein